MNIDFKISAIILKFRSNLWFLFIALATFSALITSCKEHQAVKENAGSTYKLYFLGGQSNMEGYGYNDDLPESYKKINQDVMIFSGNPVNDDRSGGGYGHWMPLSPGYGIGYSSTKYFVNLSNRFGPELSFGIRMAELTDEKIAIIKYAKGSSSIALGTSSYGTWAKDYNENTTINQWDHFKTTLNLALSKIDIDGDGAKDTLIPSGILWMQGEADAYDEKASKLYLENLSMLMSDITKAFGVENLPIVLCRIEDSGKTPQYRTMPYIESVWDAQKKYADSNSNVALIRLNTPVEFLKDKWHYKSKHYIEMGHLFAEKILLLNDSLK